HHPAHAVAHRFRRGRAGDADEPRNRPDRTLCRPAAGGARRSRVMAKSAPHVLLVEAPYYAHIAALLRDGAERALSAAGATFEAVQVPGAFEIPAAIGFAAKAGRYDGFVALGCVIRGETTHYDHICESTAHWLQDLAVREGLAIGYGIL